MALSVNWCPGKAPKRSAFEQTLLDGWNMVAGEEGWLSRRRASGEGINKEMNKIWVEDSGQHKSIFYSCLMGFQGFFCNCDKKCAAAADVTL